MYDPLENDNYYEWIELFNPTNQSINISGWAISDNYANDTLEPDFDHGNGTLNILPYGYAIITDHGTKFYDNYSLPNNTIRLYVDDKSIGNGLGNNGDKLILVNITNNITDSMQWIINYTDVPGYPAAYTVEGCSLSRYHNKDINDSSQDFYEGILPTPGYKNEFIETGKTQITCADDYFLINKDEKLEVILNVKNCGDFFDNITLKIDSITESWNAEFQNETLTLPSNRSANVSMFVNPCKINGCKTGEITLLAQSEKKFNESDTVDLSFEINAADLTIRNIKLYDEEKTQKHDFGEGEIVRIKAFLKNYGIANATYVKVSFYLDKFDSEHFIGSKTYEDVGKYQKYPSIKWDTKNVSPGKHTIFVIADETNFVDEIDESNNWMQIDVNIFDTRPNKTGASILITDLYYHSHPRLYNEFITLYNPSNTSFNLGGWYLTNTPCKIKTEQRKIFFPNDTIIKPRSKLILTECAKNYSFEIGSFPDLEYNTDSDGSIPQMISSKKFIMPNIGCMIALMDCYNHTIDLVKYGNTTSNHGCWRGNPIMDSGEGVILKRNIDKNGIFVDTNTSFDWINNRIFKIGQSDLKYSSISFNGIVKTFVSPDCSFAVIVDELRSANESIYFNIYEFTHPVLCDELINALLRNVSVKIFVEGSPIGGISKEEIIVLNRINSYGGNIRFIVSDRDNDIYARYVFDHAKYLVIDNKTVIVESCNWAKTGIPKNPSFGNREWGVVIKDESVAKYYLDVFLDDFNPKRCDSITFNEMDFDIPNDYFLEDYAYSGFYKPSFEPDVFIGNFSIMPVFSPDTSYDGICNLIDSAKKTIFVEQLYIYKDWKDKTNPFVKKLIDKARSGVDVRVIMNYNPNYDDTNIKINETKKLFEKNNIKVKQINTNWSIFTNVHNKGLIVDNRSVLISSINWNENSVSKNREAGVIIHNEEIAGYYADVFSYDWSLEAEKIQINENITEALDYKNTIYIVSIFTLTFALIAQDWRKRKWV